MKIIIVTVYNSENCGSYLQAYALSNFLKNQGHEVAFLKRTTKGTSHSFNSHLFNALKALLVFKFSIAISIIRQWVSYNHFIKRFYVVDVDSEFYKRSDCIILGSDTIWNLDSPYFVNNIETYSGHRFRGKHVIAYAPSAANTSYEIFNKYAIERNIFSNIQSFLVRDSYTKYLVESAFDCEAKIVCDPTLLVEPSLFAPLNTHIHIKKDFLLIYYFGYMQKNMRDAIVKFARDNNLDVFTLTKRYPSFISVRKTPDNMISYFSRARYVVTNTFHGTALSILYNIPFAVYNKGLKKVEDLLGAYCQEFRLFDTSEEMINKLCTPINEESKNITIINRENSKTYLLNELLKINK